MSLKITELKKCDLTDCAKLLVSIDDKWEGIYDAQVYLDEYLDNPQFVGFVAKEGDRVAGVCFGRIQSYHTSSRYIIDEFFYDAELKASGVEHLLIRFVNKYLAEDGTGTIICPICNDDEVWTKNGFERDNTVFVGKCQF